MKIRRFDMEDWLNDHSSAELNLGESGCEDYDLGDYLSLCGSTVAELSPLWCGNNDTRGSEGLRHAIASCYETVGVGDVLAANGTSEALFTFFNEILEPGDEVIVPVPAFQCLFEVPDAIGCSVKTLDVLECPRWRLDIERLDEMVTDRTRLVIINTPHNPLGWKLSPTELASIGEIARRHDAYLLFDEHYRYLDLAPGSDLIPSGFDICRPLHEKTFATGSMIKCFGVVGIRIGWLLGDAEILARCRDYKDYLTHTIPLITDHLARIGLEHRKAIIEAKKADIIPNLELLQAFMTDHSESFEFFKPEGGVVCFPRLRTGDALQLCQRLVANQGVSLLPGFAFGAPHHVRMNFGVSREKFARALDRIDDALRSPTRPSPPR